MDDIRLIRGLAGLAETNHYIQLLPGTYSEGRCWSEDAVYIPEEVFGYLEGIIERHAPEFNHFAFTDVPREKWLPILADLSTLADRLDTAKGMNDVRNDLYFLFTPSEERFAEDFPRHAREFAALIRDTVEWVREQLKTHDGVAILGM